MIVSKYLGFEKNIIKNQSPIVRSVDKTMSLANI